MSLVWRHQGRQRRLSTAISRREFPRYADWGRDFTGNNRFGALISALAKDADANVLSTPTVVTLDNEEAEIIVGQNVPFVTGSYTTSTSSRQQHEQFAGGQPVSDHPARRRGHQAQGQAADQRRQRRQAGNRPGSLQRGAFGQCLTQGRPPTSAIKTNVLVENGQILVLGGLIDDKPERDRAESALAGRCSPAGQPVPLPQH
jgi:general secretion pathway protein D